MNSSGIVGRTLGLLVFIGGIALLGLVFWLSWQIFLDPGLTAGPGESPGDELLPRLSTLIVRLAFLLTMCVAASLIASKGIQLYVADETGLPARRRKHRAASEEPASDRASSDLEAGAE